MECEEILAILSDYVDDELAPDLCAGIRRHLAECGDCRVVVDTLRRTVALYRAHGHEPLPEDARGRLYAVLSLERAAPGAPEA